MDTKTNMVNYYDTRTKIRKLYLKDTSYKGDLVESILMAKMNFNCIEQITVAIQEYNILVILSKDTTSDNKQNVISYIIDRINDFVSNNINELNISEDDKNKIMNGYAFVDYHVLGNTIKFLL